MLTKNFKVEIQHENLQWDNKKQRQRRYYTYHRKKMPYSGRTVVTIKDYKGEVLGVGEAIASLSDNWCRAKGIIIAVTRAWRGLLNAERQEIRDALLTLPSIQRAIKQDMEL